MAEALSHQLPRLDMNERTGHAHSGEPLTAVTSGEVSSDRDRYSQATLTEEERALEGDPIRKLRARAMPYAAEFIGTAFFVMFGCGANAQLTLTSSPEVRAQGPAGNWMSLAFGWGAGLAMAVWISGGGHINPAVTLAMVASLARRETVFRGFSWRRVPVFWLCQLLGALVGAAIVYGNYVRAIDIFEGGRHIRTLATAGIFGTVPLPYVTNVECFFSELTATALLVMGVFALTDQATHGMHQSLAPIGVFILFTGIATAFGAQTSFAANPARDLGPRLLTGMAGYGRQVFTLRNCYFLYSPIIGGFTGGLLGAGLYDLFLCGDRLNIVNKLVMRRRFGHVEPKTHRGGV